MPKEICIYVEDITERLVMDVNHPHRTVPILRFGWDTPAKIWEAMDGAVSSIICSRVRLVQQDGTPIMTVEDRTDAAIIAGLNFYASDRRLGSGALAGELCWEFIKQTKRTGWKG